MSSQQHSMDKFAFTHYITITTKTTTTKLLGRSEDDLENELKIVKAISKDTDMNCGLETCAKICLKKGTVHSKTYEAHLRRTLKK
jgi:hypothetical protein